jgi:hypothetical protein
MSKNARTPSEELALRRAQLARRERRVATKSAEGTPPAAGPTKESAFALDGVPSLPAVQAAKERAVRMAQAELDLEKKARAEAEHRAAEMALRALEAEREARAQVERRLQAERRATDSLQVRTQAKGTRNAAATIVQAAWRGYWIRTCIGHGRSEMDVHARTIQAAFRSKITRKAVVVLRQQKRDEGGYHFSVRREAPTVLPMKRLKTIVFDCDGPLLIGFDKNMSVQEVDEGGPGDLAGVKPGWRLVSIEAAQLDHPVAFQHLGFRQAMGVMRNTRKPWTTTFECDEVRAHRLRTINSLLDEIRSKLDINPASTVQETISAAISQTGASDANQTLHHTISILCHRLQIDVENEPPKVVLLGGCKKPDFDGHYSYVDHANGRPHWAKSGHTARHLYYGSNDMWLLRKSFDINDPNASAFLDTDDALPLGCQSWHWYEKNGWNAYPIGIKGVTAATDAVTNV